MSNENFLVQRALVLPREQVTRQAFWQAHVNGWFLPISGDFWEAQVARDITYQLKKLQKAKVA